MPNQFLIRIFFACCLSGVPVFLYAGALENAIDRCIYRVTKNQQNKNEKKKVELDFSCPGLTGRIQNSPIADLLQYRFDSVSSISDLRDIRQFLGKTGPAHKQSFHYDYVGVDALLKDVLIETPQESAGVWDKFFEWIKQYLPEPDPDNVDQLVKFLDSISAPDWLSKAIFYVAGVFVLASALWILLREWLYYRRAGPGAKRRIFSRSAGQNRDTPASIMSLDDLSSLPMRLRLPALLSWVIREFVHRGDLPASQSLTNRELLGILQKQDNSNRDYFRNLVDASELLVYGNRQPNEEGIEDLLDGARIIDKPGEGVAS